MKKLLCFLFVGIAIVLFSGCEISDAELANSLEGNMTRLVYQIGYLDSIPSSDIAGLVSSSNYFGGSSLNSNGLNNNISQNSNLGGYNDFSNSSFRSNIYNSNYTNNLDNVNSNNLLNSTGNAETSTLGGLNNNFNKCNCDNCDNCRNNNVGSASFNTIENASNTLENNSPNLNNTTSVLNNVADVNNDTSSGVVSYVDMSLIETCQADLNEILLSVSQKRGIIMLYCTDLRAGTLDLNIEDKDAISEYISILKETTNYLSNSTGILTNHYNNIVEIATLENNQELVNAKLIRASEVLKTRYAKLDTCIDSLDAIISIMKNYVGYDYSTIYNQNTLNNTTINNNANVNTNNNLAENLSNIATIEDNNNLNDGLNSQNSLVTNQQNTNSLDTAINGKLLNDTLPNDNFDDQNNTIINNNYSGSSPLNNNVAGTSIENSTIGVPNQNIALDNTLTDKQLEVEVVLNGGLVKNNPDNNSINNAFNNDNQNNTNNNLTNSNVVDNNSYPNNNSLPNNNLPNNGVGVNNNSVNSFDKTNNSLLDNENNGIDTIFNNSMSSPNDIKTGSLISSSSLNSLPHALAFDNTPPKSIENTTENLIDSIENPQMIQIPEPVKAPNFDENLNENTINRLPELILGDDNTTPPITLPFVSGDDNSNNLTYLDYDFSNDNIGFPELGFKYFQPIQYEYAPLKYLPMN